MAPAGARHCPGTAAGAALAGVRRCGRGAASCGVCAFQPEAQRSRTGPARGRAGRCGCDVPPATSRRWAALVARPESREPSAADPARPHLPDRRAGPPASWPEPEADRPVAGRELRAAVPRRPVGSDPQGAEAGARTRPSMVRGYAAWPCAHARPVRSGVALAASGPADSGGPDPHRAGGGCHGPPVQRRCREPWPRYHVQSRQVRARHVRAGLGCSVTNLPTSPTLDWTDLRRHPSGGALAREEFAALENERRVLQHATGRPAATARSAAVPRVPASRMANACADAACRRGRPGGGSSCWRQRRCRVPHRTSARNSWARSRRLSTGI